MGCRNRFVKSRSSLNRGSLNRGSVPYILLYLLLARKILLVIARNLLNRGSLNRGSTVFATQVMDSGDIYNSVVGVIPLGVPGAYCSVLLLYGSSVRGNSPLSVLFKYWTPRD